MRFPRILLFLALIFLIFPAACKKPAKWLYQATDYQRGFENCKPKEENCTFLKFTYPVFSQGPDQKALPAINRRILDFIVSPTGEKKTGDLASFTREFFAEFQDFRRQFPKAPQVWSVEREVKVLADTPRLLSLSLEEFTYLGGAHPNSNRSLVSLNPATGAAYSLKDLLVADYQTNLEALGEKQFRVVREIPAGQSLDQAGFEFESGSFRLSDNFAASNEGLVFYFNPYEIGPYVLGPTEVLIAYPALKDLIKSRGPLQGLAK